MRGLTKPVSFVATYNGQAKDPWGNTRAAFAANTRINRYDYGLTYNSALETGGVLTGETVDIILKLEFIKQSNTASVSR
jgi:polyisoprenoid-binding protein YceI